MSRAIQDLIRAASANAAQLRRMALHDNEYGARPTMAEAERWERLAREAESALVAAVLWQGCIGGDD